MKVLDKATTSAAVKLVIFMVVTTLATSLLVVAIGNIQFGSSKEFKAVFSDATDVVSGDDIRVAGVKVGSVKDVEIVHRKQALVTFDVATSTPVTRATQAQVRYRNLVGQRYIALNPGEGSNRPLAPGSTIPLGRTSPALDLTVLFNGFKPLFQALSPHDVNKLSYEIIRVFQGEGGTLESLLSHTSSVTQTLASRDQVIGQLIDNLNQVLVTVGNRDDELSNLVVRLRQFIDGLNGDKKAILGSLDSISRLAVQTADLTTGIRPSLVKDIHHLRGVAGTLDQNKGELDRALQVLPIKLKKIGRTAIYGSFFNFYLCNFDAQVKLPAGGSATIPYRTGSGRCDLG